VFYQHSRTRTGKSGRSRK